MNSIFELWSQVMPERAMAAAFNLEYLLVGGTDTRAGGELDLHVVRLDGRRLGRAQRQGRLQRDLARVRRRARGAAAGGPGAPLARWSPRPRDPARHGRPGQVARRLRRREGRHAHRHARAASCPTAATARARSRGASRAACRPIPHGVWLNRGTDDERFLGAVFSERAGQAGRRVHAAVGRRRRLRRPAGARPGGGLRGRRRRLRLASSARRRTTAS